MKSKLNILGLGIGSALLLMLAVVWKNSQPYVFHGSVIESPTRAPDFTLTTAGDRTFRLSEQTGSVVLIYFGYTTCPDVCPTTLTEFKQIRRALGAQAERARLVMITVDPERDTPERVAEYARFFDPALVGLSGAASELEAVWKNFGVARVQRASPSAAGYLIDHTSRIYVIDRRGDLRMTFAFGMSVEDRVQDLRYLIEEKP